MPIVVMIWAVQARVWEALLNPTENRLVAHMHAKDYLRLSAVTPEVTLAYEKPEEVASLKGVDLWSFWWSFHGNPYSETTSTSCCFTGRFPVEPFRGFRNWDTIAIGRIQ
jgi:hypothetical protein